MISSKLELEVVGPTGKIAQATITRVTFSRSARLRRAAARGGIAFLAAIVAAAIPGLHLILGPLGILLTIFVFLSSLRTKSMIGEGRGTCPDCGGEFRIFSKADRLPFEESCDACHRPLLIRDPLNSGS